MTRATYIANMHTALDVVIAATASLPRHPMAFGANIMLGHEFWIDSMPKDALIKYVDGLAETGVDRIDLNLGLFPWFDAAAHRSNTTIAKYDAIVARIREHGLKLAFNPQYSDTYHELAGFAEWSTAALAFYEAVALRYQPDTFVVVHEPTVMDVRLGEDELEPADWVTFAEAAEVAIHRQSPDTRIGAGGLADDVTHFEAFADSAAIDVLTLDIYSVTDLPVYTTMIATADTANKPVYIAETWRTPFDVGAGGSLEEVAAEGIGDLDFEALDIKWLQALAQYARVLNVEAFTPSWTQPFFKYVTPMGGNAFNSDYTEAVVLALRRGERTRTAKAFEALVEEYVSAN